MNFNKLSTTWIHTRDNNRILIVANLVLSIGFFLSVLVLLTRHTIVTVLPPQLDQQVEIGNDTASGNYYEAWALSISELLGNASDTNIEFIKKALVHYFSPDIYVALKLQMDKEVSLMLESKYRLSFQPLQVSYEPATHKYFVTGNLHTLLNDGTNTVSMRTYEYQFKTVDYRPVIFAFNVYQGVARTQEEIAKEKRIKSSQGGSTNNQGVQK